jgi:hypothetical protein
VRSPGEAGKKRKARIFLRVPAGVGLLLLVPVVYLVVCNDWSVLGSCRMGTFLRPRRSVPPLISYEAERVFCYFGARDLKGVGWGWFQGEPSTLPDAPYVRQLRFMPRPKARSSLVSQLWERAPTY